MKDQQLTPHFKLSEFTRSSTASARGIDNSPTPEIIANLQYLCQEILEPLRVSFNTPITISSGYRSPTLNKVVGGVKNSNHLYGFAADIKLPTKITPCGTTVQDMDKGKSYLLFILDNCRFDELIWEHNSKGQYWIHVAIRRNGINRQRYVPSLLKK